MSQVRTARGVLEYQDGIQSSAWWVCIIWPSNLIFMVVEWIWYFHIMKVTLSRSVHLAKPAMLVIECIMDMSLTTLKKCQSHWWIFFIIWRITDLYHLLALRYFLLGIHYRSLVDYCIAQLNMASEIASYIYISGITRLWECFVSFSRSKWAKCFHYSCYPKLYPNATN